MELIADPRLDQLYPVHFAGWVAAQQAGDWQRVDIMDPSGSPASPIDAAGITEKFRGINPDLPVDDIARIALDMENHGVAELLALLSGRTQKKQRLA
jgi:2-methylcitrate dehydratase PrpD